jgi:5S rRNA maturation endonuclease (ribonuclease M5)
MRFGVMSFFYTNYEARTILPNIEPRYIQSDFKFESDFIFLPNRDNQLTKIIDQKLLYVNPEHYSESKIEFEEVYVVEGLFDALKLNLYLNKPVMSLGGWNKYKNSLLFIKMLETLFSTFRINKLIYLFDKDIEFNKIQVVADTILSYKSLLPIENVYFTKINSERYKDVGDIMNPEELKQILKQTINP